MEFIERLKVMFATVYLTCLAFELVTMIGTTSEPTVFTWLGALKVIFLIWVTALAVVDVYKFLKGQLL